MSGWSEEALRKAASWRAFKEGQSLFAGGAVTEVRAGSQGFQGVVKVGKRPFRVAVMIRSATDWETRCPCPENQSTGALCGHGVAVGLAAIHRQSGAPASVANDRPTDAEAVRAVAVPEAGGLAWRIVLAGPWREALSRGVLAVRLLRVEGTMAGVEDARLSHWLAARRVAIKTPLQLSVRGGEAGELLDVLAGHPRIEEGEGSPVEVIQGGRLPIQVAAPVAGRVRISTDLGGGAWVALGAGFWQFAAGQCLRLGSADPPPGLNPLLARLIAGETPEVPVQTLLAEIESWQTWMECSADDWLGQLHFLPAPVGFHLHLDGSIERLDARLEANYEGLPPITPGSTGLEGLPRLDGKVCLVRHVAAEMAAVKRLETAGFSVCDVPGRWSLAGEDAVIAFVQHHLASLRGSWQITESSRCQQALRKIALVTPEIRILGSGEDWLSFDLAFKTTDGSVISAAEVRRLLRGGKGDIRGRRVVVSDEVADSLEPLLGELDLRQEGDGRYRASKLAGEVIKELSRKLGAGGAIDEGGAAWDRPLPTTLKADLRPYQRKGVAWLDERARWFGGGLLADDMGLGKTIQTIAWIERLFETEGAATGVVLVVATASLVGNWRAEFGKFAPGRVVRVLHGSGRDRERERVAEGEVVVTSYGTLARDLAWHLRQDYRAVVLDEASLMRNPDTDYAKAVFKLRARARVALTGTPVENGVRDLWSIFRFVQPGWLGGRESFRQTYEEPLASGVDPAVLKRLRLKVSPLVLRRTKEQVAPELPAKWVIDDFCDLSPDQAAVYRDLLEEGRKRVEVVMDSGQAGAARMQVLTALLRLRQACCDLALLGNDRLKSLLVARRSAKLQRLLELLEEAISGGHRVLVFSQFQTQLVEIEKQLEERGWASLRLDGQTRDRQRVVERFQAEDGPPVFLISLKAGGYGLNLTAADVVVHFDPWWNPAAEAQATDRAHRLGQVRPVTVYRLLTRGTVEEKIRRLQERKRGVATALDESGAGEAAGWSLDELRGMLAAD